MLVLHVFNPSTTNFLYFTSQLTILQACWILQWNKLLRPRVPRGFSAPEPIKKWGVSQGPNLNCHDIYMYKLLIKNTTNHAFTMHRKCIAWHLAANKHISLSAFRIALVKPTFINSNIMHAFESEGIT